MRCGPAVDTKKDTLFTIDDGAALHHLKSITAADRTALCQLLVDSQGVHVRRPHYYAALPPSSPPPPPAPRHQPDHQRQWCRRHLSAALCARAVAVVIERPGPAPAGVRRVQRAGRGLRARRVARERCVSQSCIGCRETLPRLRCGVTLAAAEDGPAEGSTPIGAI